MTKAKTEVHLFINAYVDPNPERNAELVECIKQNIANKSIDKVWLLCDIDYPDKYKGATNLYEFERPTFRDFFAWANELCNEGDIAIIANTDIYFDETISFVHDIQNHECLALSRYDVQYDGSLKPFHRQDSQDAWIMRTPIKEIEARFTMGLGGCISGDSILNYNRGKRSGSRPKTAAKLFTMFNNMPDFEMKLRSYSCDTGDVTYNKILGIYHSGVKTVFRVTLEGGVYVDATNDHPILSKNKFIPLEHLKVGDSVTCIGSMKNRKVEKKKPGAKRKEVYVCNHPNANKKITKGHTYYKIRRAIVAAEAHMNGMSLPEFIEAIKDPEVAKKMKFIEKGMEVHHIDNDSMNDDPSNLQVLTKAEHSRIHFHRLKALCEYTVESKIVSIQSIGEKDTYDIKMQEPNSNFECNGVFVHNCDNVLAYQLNEAGYKLTNPCSKIRAIHLHLTNLRRYTEKDRLKPPYKMVIPK